MKDKRRKSFDILDYFGFIRIVVALLLSMVIVLVLYFL